METPIKPILIERERENLVESWSERFGREGTERDRKRIPWGESPGRLGHRRGARGAARMPSTSTSPPTESSPRNCTATTSPRPSLSLYVYIRLTDPNPNLSISPSPLENWRSSWARSLCLYSKNVHRALCVLVSLKEGERGCAATHPHKASWLAIVGGRRRLGWHNIDRWIVLTWNFY